MRKADRRETEGFWANIEPAATLWVKADREPLFVFRLALPHSS